MVKGVETSLDTHECATSLSFYAKDISKGLCLIGRGGAAGTVLQVFKLDVGTSADAARRSACATSKRHAYFQATC